MSSPGGSVQNVSRFWQAGSFALDQGDTGHCGGFALANEAQSSPFRVTGVNNDYAHHAYYYAKDHKFDPWGREDGTSTQAIMRVGTSIGVWRGYAWSFSLADLRLSLEVGPTLCGTVWRTDMFTPNRDGVILPTGFDEGGHLWLLDGWYANFRGRSGKTYGALVGGLIGALLFPRTASPISFSARTGRLGFPLIGPGPLSPREGG
jgi:hypothetical protein